MMERVAAAGGGQAFFDTMDLTAAVRQILRYPVARRLFRHQVAPRIERARAAAGHPLQPLRQKRCT